MADIKDQFSLGEDDLCEPDLAATVGNFANRIARKMREQELERDEHQREEKVRQARILKAMTSIRRALQEAHKIQLGDRCSFQLEVSDWDGWPKVELLLVDSLAPDFPVQGLVVIASDRNRKGKIVFRTLADKPLGYVDVGDQVEYQRIPFLLKRIVRDFLDSSSTYVLNPPSPDEILAEQTKALSLDDEDEGRKLESAEFFIDEISRHSDNVVETATEEPLELKVKRAADERSGD